MTWKCCALSLLMALPLASQAQQAAPDAPPAAAPAPAAASATAPAAPEGQSAPRASVAKAPPPMPPADLSTLQTTDFNRRLPSQDWQQNPSHRYDRQGTDCTLYPARCR